jgi:regulator of sigma E protease
LALANILPIPALDGGKIVFLAIEALRGKPINSKIENRITGTFFVLIIFLMLFVTIKFDIPRLF